ASGQDFMRF
uniref:CalliFMRFamide-6 n=1 Tax=Calliphora vomitoria TaxID=27454 RepID=FAR6_CALVO|nr:RecName: Full=CalliFMRFamide-6 [Calliphora vomitoria]